MQDTEKYYLEIKDKIIDTEATIKVKDYSKNKIVLKNYYEIGRLIVEAQGGENRNKYGNKLIKEYALKLTNDLGKGYSWRNLYNMRSYYIIFSSNEILQALPAKLSWSHYCELISLKDINAIKYYIDKTLTTNMGYRQLHNVIKSKEYESLSLETKQKLIENKKPKITEIIKNPIIINNPNDIEIKIGDRYYKIDLLLYNIEYESYVVVELKIGELKKENIGQIGLYMNYIDKHIKKSLYNKIIGIILCHKNNKLIMEYCSNPDIISREYILC